MRGPREAADASVGVGAAVGVAVRGCQRRLLGDGGLFLVGTAMTTPKLALSVLVVMRMMMMVDVPTRAVKSINIANCSILFCQIVFF